MTRCLVAACVLSLAPGIASAATIDFTGMGKAEIVTVAGVRNVSAWAGELNWAWLDGKPAGLEDTFYSYCVDLLNNEIDHQDVTVTTVDAASAAGAQKAAWLFNTYAAIAHTGTGAMAAGLQLAIWEVLYDDGLSLTSGAGFWAVTTGSYATTAAAIAAGSGYLTGLQDAGGAYQTASGTVLDVAPGQGQDQIIRTPEPGTLLLLGVGFAGVAAGRRRRKTSQA